MLSKKQIEEIREHLEKAQNPIFYYDNDADGLCSFVLLRKFIGRGKGVAVRSFPDLNGSYARKAQELNADYVFVLDKPLISQEFVEEIEKLNLSLVWIDHHELQPEEDNLKILKSKHKNFFVYNPTKNKGKKKSNEPVTYLVHKVANRKEDLWLAVVGCVADHFIPDFIDEFEKQYQEFWGKVKNEFQAFFDTEIGKIAMALNFGLKDSTTNIVRLQNFLISCKAPGEVLAENSANYYFRKKYYDIKRKYDELIDRAKTFVENNMIFFEYSGEISMSSEIANGLAYLYPNKHVAVAFKNGSISNLSLRGKNVKKILLNILKNVEGTGGGHEDAVGARINVKDLPKFKELFEKEVREKF